MQYPPRMTPPVVADLRSDTVTRPTPGMRAAIAAAEVGDDLYREDPTVIALEERVAALIGKPAALFTPSGTMANQLALRCHTSPGEDALCSEGAHIKWYEAGAAAALASIHLTQIGQGGLITVADLEAAYQAPRVDHAAPLMRLLCLENTHNRGGGRVFPMAQLRAVCGRARELGMRLHLDGARLWNAAVALSRPPAELAAPFDTVSVCLSKGLGAPVGSLLCGDAATVETARRFRRMYGGSMRQAGVLAAAGIYAITHHMARLAEDHENAQRIARKLRGLPGVTVVDPVETNIVLIDLSPPLMDAAQLTKALQARGVLAAPFGPRRLRVVTHLDVSAAACEQAAEEMRSLLCA